jgi:hypothetical protein
MVGATGFEPATSRPPAVRATELRHAPLSIQYNTTSCLNCREVPHGHDHICKQARKSVATPPQLGPAKAEARLPALRSAPGASHPSRTATFRSPETSRLKMNFHRKVSLRPATGGSHYRAAPRPEDKSKSCDAPGISFLAMQGGCPQFAATATNYLELP